MPMGQIAGCRMQPRQEEFALAVKIRLARHGAKKAPYYRIVVADAHARRDGRFIEQVGTYNPNTDPSTIKIDQEKVAQWIAQGAQPTDVVKKLIDAAKEA